MRRPHLQLLALALLANVVTGCVGAPTESPGTTGPAGSGTPSSGPSSPTDLLLLRVATDGGFVPPGFIVTRLPEISVYADGRVIRPGAVPAIYPGPAVSPLVIRQLDRSGIEGIRAAARAAGLAGPDRAYANAAVADAPTTVLTYVDADGPHRLSIYALGMQLAPGASEEEKAARLAAATLLKAVDQIIDAAAPGRTYEPTAFRIFALRDDLAASPSAASPSAAIGLPVPNVLDWPAGLPPLASLAEVRIPAGARCGVIEGSRLPAFTRLLQQATQITRYRSDGAAWTLLIRPLLPDEAAVCG